MTVEVGAAAPTRESSSPLRVIITGGASGIGRATALKLLAADARVMVLDVDDTAGGLLAAEQAPTNGWLRFRHADVASEDDVRSAVEAAVSELGGIDVLISAAGIMRGQLEAIGELEGSTWDQVVDVNLKGAFLAAKYVAPIMVEQGSGVVILVGSKAGVSVGSGSFAYGASKGGIHGLTLALDRHLRPAGVRVNEVCPGDVDTPLFRRSVAEGVERGGDAEAAAELLRHLVTPEDVGDVLAFLASGAASAVRGTVFTA